jgi:apolipoprotein N-acyltransferase
MALANDASDHAWLGWFSLVPLFLVIRLWRPVTAMLAGSLWGLCLLIFSSAQNGATVYSSFWLLLLLPAVPALYTGLCAWLTRRIGFNPFVLGVAWMGVELALAPMGVRTGLVAVAEGGGTLIHWIGGLLGYVLIAFLVALVNASLVSLLSSVHLRIPQLAYRIPSSDFGASIAPRSIVCLSLFATCPSRPRAPPLA